MHIVLHLSNDPLEALTLCFFGLRLLSIHLRDDALSLQMVCACVCVCVCTPLIAIPSEKYKKS